MAKTKLKLRGMQTDDFCDNLNSKFEFPLASHLPAIQQLCEKYYRENYDLIEDYQEEEFWKPTVVGFLQVVKEHFDECYKQEPQTKYYLKKSKKYENMIKKWEKVNGQ